MRIEQLHSLPGQSWPTADAPVRADLVLVFGATARLDAACVDSLKALYPGAILFGCSTAGDIPEGSYARLMKANFDRLVEGASGAARLAREGTATPGLALLISCVGRKLVLQQRVEEEVEGVRKALGAGTALTGDYSYGEISPYIPTARCELHNQTMTITTFSEEA